MRKILAAQLAAEDEAELLVYMDDGNVRRHLRGLPQPAVDLLLEHLDTSRGPEAVRRIKDLL